MGGRRSRGRRAWAAVVGVAAVGLVLGAQTFVTGTAAAAPHAGVRPNGYGELDCNGYSTIQHAVARKLACTDIRGFAGGAFSWQGRFYDNGHYIGHDEPSIRYESSQPGSGDDVTFTERLGVDPTALPTVAHPGSDVVHFFELTPAPWFGMTICDPQSEPQFSCTPESDANAPHGRFPGGGAAFMEMQFYPPGDPPFVDSISCDDTHWCAALTIDSLECTPNGVCNSGCIEPVNFAFIQTNGVPPGPPSPQLSDLRTFTPNAHTLLMNPGDLVTTHMYDAPVGGGQRALEIRLLDRTTGQSGFMIASAANGFMHTSMVDCTGTPFNFQPMYSTARPQNSDRWSVLLSGILSEYEIGHFIPCTRLTGSISLSLAPGVTDTSGLFCHGPYETAGPPDHSPGSHEKADAYCYPFGDTHGSLATAPDQVTGCEDDAFQNGDLDFDGTPYYPDWPNSLTPDAFPSPTLQQQPTTVGGAGYPELQFETDVPASEFNTCVPGHKSGCVVPPVGPGHFYPYWTQANVRGTCVWEFGHMTNGNAFGGDKQYAHLVPHGFLPFQFDLASRVRPNPNC